MLKKGINMWSFPQDWSIEKNFKEAVRAGFDGIEVVTSENGAINLNSTQEDLENIKKLANDIGIEITSVASGFDWKYLLTDNDELVREKGKSAVKFAIRAANWLGCDAVLVVPGKVTKEIPYDTAYRRTLEWLTELEPFARDFGVAIAIENVWNDFLLSPLETRDLLDKISSRYIGAYFDVGNVVKNGYPEQWIKILGERIKRVHIKDFSRGNNAFVSLLTGDVDYPAVVSALSEVGYDGYLIAEVGLLNGNAELGLKTIAESIEAIIN